MYRGQHREDEVGSLRYSDEDCLISERIGKRVEQQVGENVFDWIDLDPRPKHLVGATPDCESGFE